MINNIKLVSVDTTNGVYVTIDMLNDTNMKFTLEVFIININNTIFLQSKNTGWVGLGFGGKGMTNLDMHLASFISDSAYDIQDTYSKTITLPDNDIFLGGTNDIKFISYEKNSNGYVLVYSRLLETKDKWDYVFKKGQSSLLNIVWGRENFPVFHQDRIYSTALEINPTSNRITFSPSEAKTKPINTPNIDMRASLESHGIILVTSWFLSFFGLLAARFFKHKYYWIWIHAIAMGFPTAATLILSSSAIISLLNKTGILKPHHYIGFVMMAAVFIQFLNGLFTWSKVYRNALSGVTLQRNLNMRWFHRVKYLYLYNKIYI